MNISTAVTVLLALAGSSSVVSFVQPSGQLATTTRSSPQQHRAGARARSQPLLAPAVAASIAAAAPARSGLSDGRKLVGHQLHRRRPHHALRLGALASVSATSNSVSTCSSSSKQLRKGLPYLSVTEHAELQRALAVAFRVHSEAAGFREAARRVENAVDVCLILGELELDVDTLLISILHSSINPVVGPLGTSSAAAGISARDLERRFGRRVTRFVESFDSVSRLVSIRQNTMAARRMGADHNVQKDMMRNLILSESSDWRVVIVKVATHLQRLRRAAAARPSARATEKVLQLSREAMDLHAPLGHRMGVHQLVCELQDIAFAHLYPRQNAAVRAQIKESAAAYDEVLDKAAFELTAALEASELLMGQMESVSLAGRIKEPFSMWKKMLRQQGTRSAAEQVLDAVALRVVLTPRRHAGESDDSYTARSEALCYQAMDLVRGMYPTMESRTKDYIKQPKANGYRSLHATCISMQDEAGGLSQPFEVQVRTQEMHAQAEYGVASHCFYKGEGSAAFSTAAAELSAVVNKRASVASGGTTTPAGYNVPASVTDGKDFVNWLHAELQSRKVFVFGPDFTIWDLDKSTTVGDIVRRVSISNFYANVRGPSKVAVLVSGHPVTPDYRLRNGDTITLVV